MSTPNNADNSQINSLIKCFGTNSNFQQTQSSRSLDCVVGYPIAGGNRVEVTVFHNFMLVKRKFIFISRLSVKARFA